MDVKNVIYIATYITYLCLRRMYLCLRFCI